MHLLYLITWSWSTSEVHRNPPKGKKQQNNQKERTNSTRIALHVVRRGGDHYRRFVMHSPSRIPFSGKPRKRAELRGIYPSGHSRGKSCSYSAAACDAMRCDVHFHPPPSRGSDLVRWVCSHITTHIQTHHPTSSSPPACLPCCVLLDLFTQFLPERLCAQVRVCLCVWVWDFVRFVLFLLLYIFFKKLIRWGRDFDN